jgi:hypothetical protein
VSGTQRLSSDPSEGLSSLESGFESSSVLTTYVKKYLRQESKKFSWKAM